MAFIPAPNCVEAVLRFVWSGQIVAITLSFCRPDTISTSEMDTLAGDLYNWWLDELSNELSSDIVLEGINITDLTTQTSPSIFYPCVTGCAGGNAAGTVPNNVTLVTKFSTDSRGRSYRGRVYTPGISAVQLDSPVAFDPAFGTAITARYAELPTFVGPDGWTHVVISRRNNNADRTTAVSTEITGYSTELFVDSQRRRLEGRGD